MQPNPAQTRTLDEDIDVRDDRFFGVEVPKTINTAFGSLEHFIVFFQNRPPEIKKFSDKMQEVETSQDFKKLNNDLLPVIMDCFKKESTKKDDTKDNEEQLKRLLKLFAKSYSAWQDFYSDILKAYTMTTFLFERLNNYLRNEDWTGLHCLLPYAVCFCKAFLCLELVSLHHINTGHLADKKEDDILILYRGAPLDEKSLKVYESGEIPQFSWHAATSTTKNKKIAKRFISKKRSGKKIPVLFEIEVLRDHALGQNSYLLDIDPVSAVHGEDEVVLSPGSIFKLKNYHRHPDRAEVRLQLIDDITKIQRQGQIMYGAAIQAHITIGVKSKVACLRDKELVEVIRHKRGNELIEDLEFEFCEFDGEASKNLYKLLKELPNLNRLALLHLSTSTKGETYLSNLTESLGELKLRKLKVVDRLINDEQTKSLANIMYYLCNLKSLKLIFEYGHKMTDTGLHSLSSAGLSHMSWLTALTLNFAYCNKLTDTGLHSLSSTGLSHLPLLTALTLNFAYCDKLNDAGLYILSATGLSHLSSLIILSLNFKECSTLR